MGWQPSWVWRHSHLRRCASSAASSHTRSTLQALESLAELDVAAYTHFFVKKTVRARLEHRVGLSCCVHSAAC